MTNHTEFQYVNGSSKKRIFRKWTNYWYGVKKSKVENPSTKKLVHHRFLNNHIARPIPNSPVLTKKSPEIDIENKRIFLRLLRVGLGFMPSSEEFDFWGLSTKHFFNLESAKDLAVIVAEHLEILVNSIEISDLLITPLLPEIKEKGIAKIQQVLIEDPLLLIQPKLLIQKIEQILPDLTAVEQSVAQTFLANYLQSDLMKIGGLSMKPWLQILTSFQYNNVPNTIIDAQAHAIMVATDLCSKALNKMFENYGIYQGNQSPEVIKHHLAQEILTESRQKEIMIFGGVLSSPVIDVHHFPKTWTSQILLYFNEKLTIDRKITIQDLEFDKYQEIFEKLYDQLENFRQQIHKNRGAYSAKKIQYQLDQYYENFKNSLIDTTTKQILYIKKFTDFNKLEKHIRKIVINHLKQQLYTPHEIETDKVLIHTLKLDQILASYGYSKERIITHLINNNFFNNFENLTVSEINNYLKNEIQNIINEIQARKKAIQEPLLNDIRQAIFSVESNQKHTIVSKIVTSSTDETKLILDSLPGSALLMPSKLSLHQKSGAWTRRILGQLEALNQYTTTKINKLIAFSVERAEKTNRRKNAKSLNYVKETEISTHKLTNEKIERLFKFQSIHEDWTRWTLSLNQTTDRSCYIVDKNDQQKIVDLVYAGLKETFQKVFYLDVDQVEYNLYPLNFKDLVKKTIEDNLDFLSSDYLAISKKLVKESGFAYLVLKNIKNKNINLWQLGEKKLLTEWANSLPISKIWQDLVDLGLLKDPLFHRLNHQNLFITIFQKLEQDHNTYTKAEYAIKVRKFIVEYLKNEEQNIRQGFIKNNYICTLNEEINQFYNQITDPESVKKTDFNISFDLMLKKENSFDFSKIPISISTGDLTLHRLNTKVVKFKKPTVSHTRTAFSLAWKDYKNYLKNLREKDKIRKKNIENLLQDNGKIKFPITANSVLKFEDLNRLLAAISAFGIAKGFQDPAYQKILEEAAVLEILLLQNFNDSAILLDLQARLQFLQAQFSVPQHILERLNFQAVGVIVSVASNAVIDTVVDQGVNYLFRKILNLPFSSTDQAEIDAYVTNEEHKAYLEAKKREKIWFGNALNTYKVSKNFDFRDGFLLYLDSKLSQKYGLKLKNLNFNQNPLQDLWIQMTPKIGKCTEFIKNSQTTPLQVKKMMETILEDFFPALDKAILNKNSDLYSTNFSNSKNKNLNKKQILELSKKIKKRFKNNLFYPKNYTDHQGITHELELSLLLGARISLKEFNIDFNQILNDIIKQNRNYTEGELITLAYQKAQTKFQTYHQTIASLQDQNHKELNIYSIPAENISKIKLTVKNILREVGTSNLISETLKNSLKAGANLSIGFATLNPVCIFTGVFYSGATVISPIWYGLKFIGTKIYNFDKEFLHRNKKIIDLNIKTVKNSNLQTSIQKPSFLKKTTDLQSYYFSSEKELVNNLYKNFKKYYQEKTGNSNFKKKKIQEAISKILKEKNIIFPSLLPVGLFEPQNFHHYFFESIIQKLMEPAFQNINQNNFNTRIQEVELTFLKSKKILCVNRDTLVIQNSKIYHFLTKILTPQPHALIQTLTGSLHENLQENKINSLKAGCIKISKIVDLPFYPLHWVVKKIIYHAYDKNSLYTRITKILEQEVNQNNLFFNISLPLSVKELAILIQNEIAQNLKLKRNASGSINENELQEKVRNVFLKICENHPAVLNNGKLVENLHLRNKLYLEGIFCKLTKNITDQSPIFNLLQNRFPVYCKKLSQTDTKFNFLSNLTPEKIEEYRHEIFKQIDFGNLQSYITNLISNPNLKNLENRNLNIWRNQSNKTLEEIFYACYQKPNLANELISNTDTKNKIISNPKIVEQKNKFLQKLIKNK